VRSVHSIMDLSNLMHQDPQYGILAKVAASNLGAPCETPEVALRALRDYAGETSEQGIVDEINFVLDIAEEEAVKAGLASPKPWKGKARGKPHKLGRRIR